MEDAKDPAELKSKPLQTERQQDGKRKLLRDLEVEVDFLNILVGTGTLTDFSTIPWYGRILVRWSKVDIAGVVHDHLYHEQDLSRARADRIWRLCAISGQHRANAFQAWVGWAALRVGGWIAWNQCTRRAASGENKSL